METETVTGYVDHIIYRNAENGYTVLVLVVNEEELTCVGTFSDIAEGENIEAHGEYTEVSGLMSHTWYRTCTRSTYCQALQEGYLPHHRGRAGEAC